MNRTLHIFPLRVTPYSDRTCILSAYSRELGAISFAVPAGSGAGAARRRALLMPMNLLEVEAQIRPGREVHTLREPRALMPLHGVMASPARSAVAMFLAEALGVILRQGEGDPRVFDFIAGAMERLNSPGVPAANFHLAFLVGLATVLGIAPDAGDFRPGRLFDMVDACFRQSAALHGRTLSPEESMAAERLCRLTWENMGRYRFSREQRARALDRVLEYYTLHYANLSSLKSPGILRML